MKTIDERLEALTERHEALTMSVEMLLADSRELFTTAQEHTKQLAIDGEHIRALARIAEIHERRITAVEEGH